MTGQAAPGRRRADLVDVVTSDGRTLEGLLHEPAGSADVSVLLLHGKGGNFYSGVCRFLPPRLARAGVRTLALNMRSHDLGYTLVDVPFVDLENGPALVDGGMWEDLDAGPLDVRAGIDFLLAEGAHQVVLCGHSSGAFYSAVHDSVDPAVSARVLLSPLVSNRRPLEAWFADRGGLEQALRQAREMVDAGRGDQLIATSLWYYAISATALLQRAAERPNVFVESLAEVTTPVLLAWGEREGRGSQWAEIARARTGTATEVFAAAEHHYLGQEETVADSILSFLEH